MIKGWQTREMAVSTASRSHRSVGTDGGREGYTTIAPASGRRRGRPNAPGAGQWHPISTPPAGKAGTWTRPGPAATCPAVP